MSSQIGIGVDYNTRRASVPAWNVERACACPSAWTVWTATLRYI